MYSVAGSGHYLTGIAHEPGGCGTAGALTGRFALVKLQRRESCPGECAHVLTQGGGDLVTRGKFLPLTHDESPPASPMGCHFESNA